MEVKKNKYNNRRSGLSKLSLDEGTTRVPKNDTENLSRLRNTRSEEDKAYDYAVWYLSQRLRTKKELELRLLQKKYSQKSVTTTIKRLVNEKFLNDGLLIESVINYFKAYKPYGYYMVKKKLMMRFFEGDLINQALSEQYSEEDELKVAKRVLKKHLEFVRKTNIDEKEALSLHRKGFRMNVLSKLMNRS